MSKIINMEMKWRKFFNSSKQVPSTLYIEILEIGKLYIQQAFIKHFFSSESFLTPTQLQSQKQNIWIVIL